MPAPEVKRVCPGLVVDPQSRGAVCPHAPVKLDFVRETASLQFTANLVSEVWLEAANANNALDQLRKKYGEPDSARTVDAAAASKSKSIDAGDKFVEWKLTGGTLAVFVPRTPGRVAVLYYTSDLGRQVRESNF